MDHARERIPIDEKDRVKDIPLIQNEMQQMRYLMDCLGYEMLKRELAAEHEETVE